MSGPAVARAPVLAPSAFAEGAMVLAAGMVVALACVRPADGAGAPLTAADGWLRPAHAGATTAAYVTLANPGPAPVTVTGATTAAAESVALHDAAAGGAMRARTALVVPPGGRLVLAPGDLHLMLVGVRHPLVEGVPVELRLTTDDGRVVTARARVRR